MTDSVRRSLRQRGTDCPRPPPAGFSKPTTGLGPPIAGCKLDETSGEMADERCRTIERCDLGDDWLRKIPPANRPQCDLRPVGV